MNMRCRAGVQPFLRLFWRGAGSKFRSAAMMGSCTPSSLASGLVERAACVSFESLIGEREAGEIQIGKLFFVVRDPPVPLRKQEPRPGLELWRKLRVSV